VNTDEIIVEEKFDGANMRFWKEDGKLIFGSRNVNDIQNKQFNKPMKYLRKTVNLSMIDEDLIYVGEAMLSHSITYDWDNLPGFIGFDVLHKDTGQPLNYKIAKEKFGELGLEFINILFEGTVKEFLDIDETKFLETSKYRTGKPEGFVIKNYSRLNQYGRPLFAKVVNEEFSEKKKAKFGTAKIKKSDTPLAVKQFVTEARIRKIILKLTVEEGYELERPLMKHLIPAVIKDFLDEHIVEIYEDKNINNIDFQLLHKIVPKHCLRVLDNMIQNKVA
jgi:ATP-dependent RNA circularization protein (DNA/RNA ligase family)